MKKKITISIDLSVYEKISTIAEKEDRSFSQQANRIFKSYLEGNEEVENQNSSK